MLFSDFEISKKIKELNIGKTLFVEPNIDSIHGYSLTSLDYLFKKKDIVIMVGGSGFATPRLRVRRATLTC